MTEFRQKLVRQPELHQPPWSLLLVPRMTPQANGEERHDLEPTMPREEYQLPHLAGGVSSQRMPSLALPEPGSHGGGMQEKWLQECSPIAAPQEVECWLGFTHRVRASCLSSWEKDMSKREWEEGSSAFIHTDATWTYCCRSFSTAFIYLEKERCSKKAPFSVMALVRYVCSLSTNTSLWWWKLICLWDIYHK